MGKPDQPVPERPTMLRSARSAAHWVARHAFPAMAATVIAVGAAGGGIGYAVASQHTTAAPTSSTSGSTQVAPSPAPTGHSATAARGAQLFQRALSLLATQTGQTVAAVRSELLAGKSVDDIAGAKAPAIASEILAQVTRLAGRAVTAGKITAAQETAGLATAKTKIEALMAEPGTQLLKDARSALQFLHGHGLKHSTPSAAATPTPAT
jgi:hypothetical protein